MMTLSFSVTTVTLSSVLMMFFATASSRSCWMAIKHILLLIGERIAKRLRPIEIVAHHLDDIRIIEQRDDAAVPVVFRLQRELFFFACRKRCASTICNGNSDAAEIAATNSSG
jgi:hypothetical protein